tara:strand:- start:469 stop:582 length:114 start_codon:yes stop_codon:yes gene_type:complete
MNVRPVVKTLATKNDCGVKNAVGIYTTVGIGTADMRL